MTPHDYKRLLAAANLAHYHPKWGFTILVDRWKMFLDEHHFYSSNSTDSFEVDTKRFDFYAFIRGTSAKHRVRVHVIRIGVCTDLSPNKIEWQKDSQGRMMSTAPRLNGLLLQQQSLRNIMDPFLWSYVIEKGLEEDSSIDESDSESVQSFERNSPSSPPPLTAVVSVAAITPVRASSLNDKDMLKLYPNLSHPLGDGDGFFDRPERQVIIPLPTQKNGSTPPLKSQDRKREARLNPPIELRTT